MLNDEDVYNEAIYEIVNNVIGNIMFSDTFCNFMNDVSNVNDVVSLYENLNENNNSVSYSFSFTIDVDSDLENIINETLNNDDASLKRDESKHLNLDECLKFEDIKTDDNECSICKMEYINTDTVYKVKCCNTIFHYECIDEWYKHKNSCPLCRENITKT